MKLQNHFVAPLTLCYNAALSTPGHSEDSITLVLNEGQAFTGDLPSPMFATEAASRLVEQGWERIRARDVKTIYPGHGPVRPLEESVH